MKKQRQGPGGCDSAETKGEKQGSKRSSNRKLSSKPPKWRERAREPDHRGGEAYDEAHSLIRLVHVGLSSLALLCFPWMGLCSHPDKPLVRSHDIVPLLPPACRLSPITVRSQRSPDLAKISMWPLDNDIGGFFFFFKKK